MPAFLVPRALLHSDTSSAALSLLMVTLTPFSEGTKWSWGQDVMDFLCCSLFHTIFLMLVVHRLQSLQGCAWSTQEHPISHSSDLFFLSFPVSYSFSPSSISYLFLNVLSQRCHRLCCRAQLCFAVGRCWAGWNGPCPAQGGLQALLTEVHSTSPCHQNHATYAQYSNSASSIFPLRMCTLLLFPSLGLPHSLRLL